MGRFSGQFDVCVVPGKCSPVELKGIDWFVFSLFLKSRGIAPATYSETGKKNKQTNPSEASLSPHPLSCYFLNRERGKGAKEQSL